jgi:ankyrin repeat protein
MLFVVSDPAAGGGPSGRTGSIAADSTRSRCVNSTAAGLQAAAGRLGHADQTAMSNLGRSPLHVVADNTSSGPTKLLLTHGASARAYHNEGRTPSHLAALFALSSGEDIISALLSGRADLAARDEEHRTPLHYGAMADSRVTATLLPRAGSLIAPVDRDGLTPMDLATQAGFADVLAQLLEHGANVATTGRAGIHGASRDGVLWARQHGRNAAQGGRLSGRRRRQGQHACGEAARRGHELTVQRLIEAGTSLNPVNSLQNTPL